MVPGFFPRVQRPGVKLTTHLHRVSRLRMRWAVSYYEVFIICWEYKCEYYQSPIVELFLEWPKRGWEKHTQHCEWLPILENSSFNLAVLPLVWGSFDLSMIRVEALPLITLKWTFFFQKLASQHRPVWAFDNCCECADLFDFMVRLLKQEHHRSFRNVFKLVSPPASLFKCMGLLCTPSLKLLIYWYVLLRMQRYCVYCRLLHAKCTSVD